MIIKQRNWVYDQEGHILLFRLELRTGPDNVSGGEKSWVSWVISYREKGVPSKANSYNAGKKISFLKF